MKPATLYTEDMTDLVTGLLIPIATTFRTIKLQPGLDRFENDAEHSFLLAVIGCAIAHRIDPSLDTGKVSQYAIVHDLVEAYAGDTTVWAPPEKHATKVRREKEALAIITKRYGKPFKWIHSTIEQYEQFADPESCFVYALDKIIPCLIIVSVDHQPFPPQKEQFDQKITIARQKTQKYPKLLGLFDEIDKAYRSRPHFFVK